MLSAGSQSYVCVEYFLSLSFFQQNLFKQQQQQQKPTYDPS